jgi:DME family drug/metabolite transporter
MASRTKGVLIALAATTAWSTTGIFLRYLLTRYTLTPLTLAFWRDLILAAALWLGFSLWKPQALRISRRDLPFLIFYGAVVLASFNALWTYSVQLNGAAVATVLAYCSPAFTVLLAWPVLREPVTARRLAAAGLSIVGCIGVAKAYAPASWQVNPWGFMVGLASGLAFAAFSLAGRWSAKRFASPWTVTAYGFLFAAAALGLAQMLRVVFVQGAAGLPGEAGLLGQAQTPLAVFFSLGRAWDGWGVLALLALGPTLTGYGLYTMSLRRLPAGLANMIASLEPALTAVLAILLLGERLDAPQWLGAGLILGAVILAQSGDQEGQLQG